MTQKKILLDAGHGGRDSGAVSISGIELEKDFNLEIVDKIADLWERRFSGWTVMRTRAADEYLSPGVRKRMIERELPNVFVSVHCNASSNMGANGIEVIHRDMPDEVLAQSVLVELLAQFPGARNRGTKTDVGDLRRSLSVLDVPAIPSILIECGFITNDSDLEMLRQTDKIADAIVKGVARWMQL